VEDAESLAQLLVETQAREMQTAEYWQVRASELRSDLASLDAQIDFIRVRLGEVPASPGVGSLLIGNGALSWTARSRTSPSLNDNFRPRRNMIFASPVRDQFAFVAGGTRGRVVFNPIATLPGRRNLARPVPLASLFTSPSLDFAYEGTALLVELDRLLAIRTGLVARQRELEDDARRAGVDPGWLRP